MSTEQNKAVARRLVEQVFNGKNLAALDEILAANYVDHTYPPDVPLPPGPQGFKQFIGMYLSAFPDLHYHLEAEIAEGELVVHHATVHGTLKGEFGGMPPTGKHATWSEIHIGRFSGGRLAEHWGLVDQMGMMQQLGLMPMPE